jgi:hypothetical protein
MAIAFVNAVAAGNDSVNSVTTGAQSATTGNLIVVSAGYRESGVGDDLAISDLAGNSYTRIGSQLDDGFLNVALFYAKNITGNANNTYTVGTTSSRRFLCVSVLQFSGADTATPYDGTTANGSTTGFTATTGSFTPTTGDLVVCAVRDYQASSFTAGSGYTIPAGATETYASAQSSQYKLGAGTSSQTADATSDAIILSMVAACFKAAGAAGGGPTRARVVNAVMAAGGTGYTRGSIVNSGGV